MPDGSTVASSFAPASASAPMIAVLPQSAAQCAGVAPSVSTPSIAEGFRAICESAASVLPALMLSMSSMAFGRSGGVALLPTGYRFLGRGPARGTRGRHPDGVLRADGDLHVQR
jgi:hypothetical protein